MVGLFVLIIKKTTTVNTNATQIANYQIEVLLPKMQKLMYYLFTKDDSHVTHMFSIMTFFGGI